MSNNLPRRNVCLPKNKSIFLDQLRKVRNDINYRGISIDFSYLQRNESQIKRIINVSYAL